MGSSGSGKFGNYKIGRPVSGTGSGSGGIGGIGDGINGESYEVDCPSIISNIRLEDVANSEYYRKRQRVPVPGQAVELRDKIHQGRLVVQDTATGDIIGNLPTEYNFLLNCIKRGLLYKGEVLAADVNPIPFSVVTLHA